MATTRIMPLHAGKGRTVERAISDIIDYVENPQKTENGQLITGYGCDGRTADAEFLLMKKEYITNTGRVRGADDVIAYHLRQSFAPGEITPEDANRIGCELAARFTKGNHAYIVCTHTDKHHIHNHIIWSAVNLECDRKFRNFWNSTRAVRRLSDTICIENGLSIVEDPKRHGKSYDKWLGDQAGVSQREQLRQHIDEALSQGQQSMETLLLYLQECGYEVKRGKHTAVRASDQKRFIRLYSLGDGYREADLLQRFAPSQSGGSGSKKYPGQTQEKVNLIIDIQKKLQEGKGKGYENWAKVFNLKQMARTLNYLMEHDLLEYDVLAECAADASGGFQRLSAQIKNLEDQMKKNADLQKHIVEYVKTREIYAAYRKAGYSKKFLAEHEAEITLHKAAKKAFDECGLAKIPTIKSLREEYGKLLAEKRKCYAAYRKARNEMKELLTVKTNVDRILDFQDERLEERSEKEH